LGPPSSGSQQDPLAGAGRGLVTSSARSLRTLPQAAALCCAVTRRGHGAESTTGACQVLGHASGAATPQQRRSIAAATPQQRRSNAFGTRWILRSRDPIHSVTVSSTRHDAKSHVACVTDRPHEPINPSRGGVPNGCCSQCCEPNAHHHSMPSSSSMSLGSGSGGA